MTWKIHVIYDADGTKEKFFESHKISTQIFPGTTTCIIRVCNEKLEEIETFQCSKVWSITKVKVGNE